MSIELKEFTNVNPKHRKTSDCVIRALTAATGKQYFDVLDELVAISKKTGYCCLDKKVYERFLDQNGFIKHSQPRKPNGKKYLVRELDEICDAPVVVISVAGHLTCVKNKALVDIYDCRWNAICSYYSKR